MSGGTKARLVGGERYRGRGASGYDAKRLKQRKWHRENKIVEEMVRDVDVKNGAYQVLDVPFGTGRFVSLWRKLGCVVVGVDSSEDMLSLARKKLRKTDRVVAEIGDASDLMFKDRSYDVVVCVRLLHLIDWSGAQSVMKELCRVARYGVVLTVQIRATAKASKHVMTHDKKKFYGAIDRLGWKVADDRKITSAGWHVMRLERKP